MTLDKVIPHKTPIYAVTATRRDSYHGCDHPPEETSPLEVLILLRVMLTVEVPRPEKGCHLTVARGDEVVIAYIICCILPLEFIRPDQSRFRATHQIYFQPDRTYI